MKTPIRQFGAGCFKPPEACWYSPRLAWLTQAERTLLTTQGSFTQALARFTGAPVQVVLQQGEYKEGLFSTAVARRAVHLHSGDVVVQARSALYGRPTPRLLSSFKGLSDTPLMTLLAQQNPCRRRWLSVAYQHGVWYRYSCYQIGQARLWICECLASPHVGLAAPTLASQTSCFARWHHGLAGFPEPFW